jgi:hypothetical protein
MRETYTVLVAGHGGGMLLIESHLWKTGREHGERGLGGSGGSNLITPGTGHYDSLESWLWTKQQDEAHLNA